MGRIVHLDKVQEFIARTPVFRARDVKLIVGDDGYTSLLLHNLVRSGKVRRITKGWYSTQEDPLQSVLAFRPAYVGLQEALSLRDLWEQETNVVIVTTSKVRPGTRRIMGSNVIVHRIKPKYFFGFEFVKYETLALPVSDLEKTLIDLVYFNESPGTQILRSLSKNVDSHRLGEYLRRYGKRFRRRFARATNLGGGNGQSGRSN